MDWLTLGGEMGKRIQGHDWMSTPMGPIEQWPQSVKTAVDIMLAAPQSVFVFWGPNQLLLFNDASLPILGDKQGWALGKPFGEVFSEIWKDFRPVMNDIMAGKSLYVENQAIPISGRPSRPVGWFTYSYSPLRDESGRVQGVFCIATETTEKVIADQALIESMDEGFAVFQTLYEDGRACDFRYLATNPAFEVQSGPAEVLGRTLKEVWPGLERHWIETFGQVMSSGRSNRFTQEAAAQGKWYECYAFRYGAEDSTCLGLLFRDVTQARLVEVELANVSRRKDEFLAMLAHELRNPLAPIVSAAQMLTVVADNPAQVRHLGQIVARQANHMTSLVNDLLDVSRVTSGLVKLVSERLDIRQVVDESIEQVMPFVEAKRHKLTLVSSVRSALVMGDRKRLVQVVTNLMQNAAKYTPDGGEISVAIEADGERIRVSIQDNGIGMDAELMPFVFDLFTQERRSSDRTQGGLGIGLALVKSLVALHNGEVQAQSDGPERGSTFTVSLPLLAALPQESLSEMRSLSVPSKPLKMLVVDDNVDAADLLGMFLETSGHRVIVQYSSADALEKAAVEKYDVFVLDIGLPDIDGNELARRLRASHQSAHATLIAVTGYGQEYDKESSIAAGFDYYFVKPANPKLLVELLARINPA